MKVQYYFRNPSPQNHSIENIFNFIINELKDEIETYRFYTQKPFDPKAIITVSKIKADVHHITGAVNYLALKLDKKKTILTVHDIGYYENNKKYNLKNWLYKKLWFDWPLAHVEIITVVSEFTKAKLIDVFKVDPKKIHVIPNPAFPHFKKIEAQEPNMLFTILQIGTGRHKNLKGLLEAVKDFPVHIIIIGNPDASDVNFLKENRMSYKAHYNITNKEVNALYNRCDLLYFASFYEGFGMPIIEAQSLGKPVITSNFGAMKEVSAGSALLVDPYDVADIKKGIAEIMNNENIKTDLVKKGYANAERYNYKTIADQYLKLYHEISAS